VNTQFHTAVDLPQSSQSTQRIKKDTQRSLRPLRSKNSAAGSSAFIIGEEKAKIKKKKNNFCFRKNNCRFPQLPLAFIPIVDSRLALSLQ